MPDRPDLRTLPHPTARRATTDTLLEPVAVAVIDFLTTALLDNPHRIGKPLRDDLAGIWSACRDTYRVSTASARQPTEVVQLRAEHRRDAYRAHCPRPQAPLTDP